MEHTIASERAHRQRLRTIFKGIRGWFDSLVADLERMALFGENKMCVGSVPLDGIGRNITRYSQMTGVRFVAHGLQFADSDVVAFVRVRAAHCQIGNSAEDDDGCSANS